MGNTVSRYTRSPSAAVFVLTLLIMLNGIRVPGATTKPSGLAEASVLDAGIVATGAVAAGTAACSGDSGCEAGCCALNAAKAVSMMKAARSIRHFLLSSLNVARRQRVSAARRDGLRAFLATLVFAGLPAVLSCSGP